jgi:hypothetical protein
MSVLSLFTAICVVLALSIIISIINVILQTRITSRIGLLEKELQEKTLAFDSLQKERAALNSQAKHETPAVDLSPHLEVPTEPQLVDDGEIRVMRNVRGTFAPVNDDRCAGLEAEMRIESTHVETAGTVPVQDTGRCRLTRRFPRRYETMEPGRYSRCATISQSGLTAYWSAGSRREQQAGCYCTVLTGLGKRRFYNTLQQAGRHA